MSDTASTVIRMARHEDAIGIAELSRDVIEYGLAWRWRPARIIREMRNPDTIVIVAEIDDDIVGFALMGCSMQSAHLSLFAVSPKQQRKGVAAQLLKWLVKSCGVAGIVRINLEVRRNNNGAVQFYQQAGFNQVGIRRGYYDGVEDAVLMSRVLVDRTFEESPG